MILTTKEREKVLYALEMQILFIRYQIEELEDDEFREELTKKLEDKIAELENKKLIIIGG